MALPVAFGVFLGLSAAALGYGAAIYFPLGQAPTTDQGSEMAALAQKVAAIDLQTINARLTALESAQVQGDLAPLKDQIARLQNELAALPSTADLRAQVDALAATVAQTVAQSDPAPAIKAAIAAEMTAVQKSAQDMAASLEAAAKRAQTSAALAQLRAALDTGGPFLSVADTLALPEVLAQQASAGIPSLMQLREGFGDAARAGLEAALRADMGQTWGERVTNFLRGQTGARSLTPREGNDPDAILSRAEAGLRQGDLTATIAEIQSLPDPAKQAMQGWIDQLLFRAEALAAFDLLTEKGN